MKNILVVREEDCPTCDEKVVFTQDENHSEYSPYGRCDSCGTEGVIVLYSDENFYLKTRIHWWNHKS